MIRRLSVTFPMYFALLFAPACSDRGTVETEPAPEVVFVGEPVREKAEPGVHIIENSFGGSELIYVPESETFDKAVLDSLRAQAERNPMATKHAIYRFGFYLYRGLVKNQGDKRADMVTVKFKFRFENYDSTYVRGDIIPLPGDGGISLASLYPNRLATYEIYSVQDFIDWKRVFWEELEGVDQAAARPPRSLVIEPTPGAAVIDNPPILRRP